MDQRTHLRQLVESDRIALGVQATSMARPVIEVCGDLGLDFVWLDFEHKGPSPYDSDELEHYARTAEASAIDLVVRLPSGAPPMIRKVLDSGIKNIVVPQVTTSSEVRKCIRASRFRYESEPGRRGSSVARANRWGGDTDGYVEREDTTVYVGVMIEDVRAMENIEEILEVAGLGFVRMGSGDMSISLGTPGERDVPGVLERREELIRRCDDHGVPLCGNLANASETAPLIDDGYRMFTLGTDLQILRTVLRDRIGPIREQLENTTV